MDKPEHCVPNGHRIEEIIIPNPENCTLTFAEDGTSNAWLDCNKANRPVRVPTFRRASNQHLNGAYPGQMVFCSKNTSEDAMRNMFVKSRLHKELSGDARLTAVSGLTRNHEAADNRQDHQRYY